MDRLSRHKAVAWCASLLFLILFLPQFSASQEKASGFSWTQVPPHLSLESASWLDSTRTSSAAEDTAQRPTKSVTTAVLLSAVLPGAGQVYTGRYWKVPIILGFSGYFAREWIIQNNRYRSARSNYSQSVQRGDNQGQGDPQLLYERDFYRDQRDRFAFYFALTYVLNLVDAYVGASLYDFEVNDDLGPNAKIMVSIPIN
jgi:hypothetical protein